MLTYFIFYSLPSTSAWANDLCQNAGGSQWCREASLIFYYSYEASAHVLTVQRTCLSHLHTEKSIAHLLLSSWKAFEQSTHRNCRNAFFSLILFLRGNGKWSYLCQLPWNQCQCMVQAGAQDSVSHHILPWPNWMAQTLRQNAMILVLYRWRRNTTGNQRGSPVFVTAQGALKLTKKHQWNQDGENITSL